MDSLNLMKKQQLIEADIMAHEDRIQDMNNQADSLISSQQFDNFDINEKRSNINSRFAHIQDLSNNRRARLQEANTLHQFYREININFSNNVRPSFAKVYL